ncbi:MAG TPA: hypothetical protein VNY84_00700 [Acidimicrobiales bacterium]|jgi:hypothetical protein|nr:hypothetical protein [Acidimicrobiales bacterium]
MSISSDQDRVGTSASGPDDAGVSVSAEEASDARQQRLTAGVAALRVRKGGALPLDRVLLIVGSVLIPLGALFILLGWYGASHTPNLFEQVPYLISGGLLGVALVAAGGFFYFGYWLTKQVYESRSQNEQLVAALNRIEGQLSQEGRGPAFADEVRNGTGSGQIGALANGRSRRRAAAGSAAVSAGPTLLATATGTMLHRADCTVVANKEGLLTLPADAAGYKPCRLCEPLTTS